MSYLMDPSTMEDSAGPTMMNTMGPTMMNTMGPTMMNPADQTMPMMMQPEVLNLNLSAPKFRLVLPFASFDRSTPTKFAGSILNWTSLVACLLFVYLSGKHGFMSGKTLTVYIVAMIFTVATTIILSSSSYQMS
jgi:hypothetical protein